MTVCFEKKLWVFLGRVLFSASVPSVKFVDFQDERASALSKRAKEDEGVRKLPDRGQPAEFDAQRVGAPQQEGAAAERERARARVRGARVGPGADDRCCRGGCQPNQRQTHPAR